MDVQIIDTEALAARDPSQLALYLRSRGWAPTSVTGGTLWQYALEGDLVEALVPASTEMRGYAGFIRQLLDLLERVEQRSQLEILRDISTSSADVQYIHSTPSSPSGTIPLNDASRALDNIRQWILSGAIAVASPFRRAVQPVKRPAQATEFMRKVRLGPTFEGSYIWSVEVPLPPRVGQEILPFEEPEIQYPSLPFERKVSELLYKATTRAHRAAQQVVHQDAGLDVFTSQTNEGVTANLCEALAGLGGEEFVPFRLAFQWALSRPAEPTPPVQFDQPAMEVLSEAAKQMRARTPEEDVRIVGNVVRLHRESPVGTGEVSVAGVVEGDPSEKLWRVWVELTEPDYNLALHAHNSGEMVALQGDLSRRGNRSTLQRLSSFQVIPEIE